MEKGNGTKPGQYLLWNVQVMKVDEWVFEVKVEMFQQKISVIWTSFLPITATTI